MDIYIKELEERMSRIMAAVKDELASIRTNRPSSKMIENIRLDYLGSEMTVKQVATINVEPPKDLVVVPWDKNALPGLEKALNDANIGLSVSVQGTLVRASLPEMTQERTAEIIKIIKASAEETKIRIRTLRDEINKKIKDLKDEDERFRGKEAVQKKVDEANEAVESLVQNKIKEVEA